jgi:arylsulfatase A
MNPTQTFTAVFLLSIFLTSINDAIAAEPAPRPNFVVIFVDNLGNGDLGCFGSMLHRTPNIDRLAEEGTKFTGFYVSSGVCTPSRASLMTGCYAQRVGMHVSDTNTAVLRPVSPQGLNPDETTIAEILKQAGYTTGIFGKWHLGDQPAFLPTRQGFDEAKKSLRPL